MGKKYELCDGKGKVLEAYDTRTLEEVKEENIRYSDLKLEDMFNRYLPLYKQINATIGAYSEEKANEIKENVKLFKEIKQQLEDEINEMTNIQQLDNVNPNQIEYAIKELLGEDVPVLEKTRATNLVLGAKNRLKVKSNEK